MTSQLIALDWGTSRLRAYLLDDVSRVVEERNEPFGIMNLPEGGFAAAFHSTCGDWVAAEPELPILASGMVGSRLGWAEVPYHECPADLAGLASQLGEVQLDNGRTLYVVSGVNMDPDGQVPDVMRGEETQVYGAVGEADNATIILPGTHSKWVRVENGAITSFATFMTGELYELMSTRSILATTMDVSSAFDPVAFDDGVSAGVDGFVADGVLHHLFGVRSLSLFGRLTPSAASSYLSGLLVGAEVGGATRAGRTESGTRLIILGDPEITERYMDALDVAGLSGEPGPPNAAAAGLYRIAARAGLFGGD